VVQQALKVLPEPERPKRWALPMPELETARGLRPARRAQALTTMAQGARQVPRSWECPKKGSAASTWTARPGRPTPALRSAVARMPQGPRRRPSLGTREPRAPEPRMAERPLKERDPRMALLPALPTRAQPEALASWSRLVPPVACPTTGLARPGRPTKARGLGPVTPPEAPREQVHPRSGPAQVLRQEGHLARPMRAMARATRQQATPAHPRCPGWV
jgi:hypothetical protein